MDKKKLFVIIETLIYVLFIIADARGFSSVYLKYTGILICFLYCLSQKDPWFATAMFFTLIADLFLLVLDDHYEYGLVSFIIVQLIYAAYLSRNCEIHIPLRIVIFVLLLSILYLLKALEPVNIMSVFYFANLLVNFISAYADKELSGLSLGFFLFICCDICVGLTNFFPSAPFTRYTSLLMWIFYLPSQVLIALHSSRS